jgi:hypothetical protein
VSKSRQKTWRLRFTVVELWTKAMLKKTRSSRCKRDLLKQPMTKAAQACFVMVFNFSAECDCKINLGWFYGFGGLWPFKILVP